MNSRTVTMSEARTHFSRISAAVNESGESVTVFGYSKPWVEIRPMASRNTGSSTLPSETREALRETEALMVDRYAERFRPLEDLFEDLGI